MVNYGDSTPTFKTFFPGPPEHTYKLIYDILRKIDFKKQEIREDGKMSITHEYSNEIDIVIMIKIKTGVISTAMPNIKNL